MAFESKKKRKFDYFDALSQQAKLASKEVRLLIEIMENYSPDTVLAQIDRAHEIEHQGDAITHEIYDNLAVDFITPIERDDIMDVAHALDDILDLCEGAVQRLYMYDIQTMDVDAIRFMNIILKACEQLELVMDEFKNFKNSKTLKQYIIAIADTEEEADALFMSVVRRLFTEARASDMNGIDLYAWDKLYKRFEDIADTCELVADTVGTVAVKNS